MVARFCQTDNADLTHIYSTVQYTVSPQPEGAAQALVTIDSPQVVLAVDPLYALTEFAVAPFKAESPKEMPSGEVLSEKPKDDSPVKAASESSLSYRVEVRHSTVLILASDTDPKAQAIELSIKDVVVAQQVRHLYRRQSIGIRLIPAFNVGQDDFGGP